MSNRTTFTVAGNEFIGGGREKPNTTPSPPGFAVHLSYSPADSRRLMGALTAKRRGAKPRSEGDDGALRREHPPPDGETVPTKYGRIVRWGRQGPKFVEAFLESGDRVELSPGALDAMEGHESEALVFVERRGRIFHYVQWVGTPADAIAALRDGVLRADEVPPGVMMVGEMMNRLDVQIDADRHGRYEQVLADLPDILPPGCKTPVLGFGRFMLAILRLSDQQVEEVGNVFSGQGRERIEAFIALSLEAMLVGDTVRWVRWPHPVTEPEYRLFRQHMHPAAKATESAAAGLADPNLLEAQLDAL